MLLAEGYQISLKAQNLCMGRGAGFGPIQLAALKGARSLRVGEIAFGIVCSQFALASFTHGGGQAGIFKAGEEQERRSFSVFLAHEEQGQEGGAQSENGRQLVLSRGNQTREPLAPAGIGDLVVVLDETYELISRAIP